MSGAGRQALRAITVVGGGSLVAVAVGVARTKVAALMVGPVGIGTIGLLTTIVTTASSIAAVGLGRAGTREIAAAVRRGRGALSTARRAVQLAAWFLGICGALLFWAASGIVGKGVFHGEPGAAALPWMAPGVAFGVVALGQGAVFGGMRRLGAIARVSVLSAIAGSVVGLLCLAAGGAPGMAGYVIAVPAAAALVGAWFLARRVPPAGGLPAPVLMRHWKSMAGVGPPFMMAGLVTLVAQLLVQIAVQRRLGAAGLGHFQAAWSISMTYLGLILSSLAADFYPRLVSALPDRRKVETMVNDQVEVLLTIAAPILLALLVGSSWVLRLLYSSQFAVAASMLRWQILGDVLKLASWPMGFVLLACGAGRRFLIAEAVAMAVFVVAARVLLQTQGLRGAGQAFLLMYVVYLPLSFGLARAAVGLRWRTGVIVRLVVLLAAAIAVAACAESPYGAWLGIGLSAGFAAESSLQLAWARNRWRRWWRRRDDG